MPYCQEAPKNAELKGLFQCQFAGANPKVFVGGIAVGQPGTIPFGLNAPLSPAGSCPANPKGPITDGSQLVDIAQNPGAGGAGSDNGNAGTPPPATPAPAPAPAPGKSTTSPVSTPPTAPTPATGAGGFKLQNGKDAQTLNAKFATLSANSACQGNTLSCKHTQRN